MASFWLLPKNGQWPCDGEIDIMEQWGRDTPTDETTGAAHIGSCANSYSNFQNFQTFSSSNYSSNFHIYSIIWEEDYIAWYVDGNKVFKLLQLALQLFQTNIVGLLIQMIGILYLI